MLIVCSGGLAGSMGDELQSRFEVSAKSSMRKRRPKAAELVPDVNPWSIHPVVIASIDYIKRPEVIRSLEALLWDLVVFDEAHALAGI